MASELDTNKSEDNYTGPIIDPHVHCRGRKTQSEKATIKSTMELAKSKGVVAICDMPNTDPPIISRSDVKERLEEAKADGVSKGYYLYVGMVTNPERIKAAIDSGRLNDNDQIEEAVKAGQSYPQVVGIKMYAGKSTGDLTVSSESEQRMVYKRLAELNYNGVLVVHCEYDPFTRMQLWNPLEPKTWNSARPVEMEITSIIDQIKFAKEYDFKGTLYIAHTSTPEAVDIVNHFRDDLHIVCAATPHHLTLSTEDMKGIEGLKYKVNPPLRDPKRRDALFERFREGKIDLLESDHAPHKIDEKRYSPENPKKDIPSGIRSLDNYDIFIESLIKRGFSKDQIYNLVYANAKRIFPKIVE